MKITESKLRQMIRGVIREFTGTATAAGAKKSGYQSADTKSKEATYDKKSTDYDTKSADYDTKAAESAPLQYRSAADKAGNYTYHSTKQRGGSTNPAYTTHKNDLNTKKFQRDVAQRDKKSAEKDWDSAKEADLKKTVPTQKPPTGGGAGYGKGKTAGKGKGKGKKKD